MTDDFTIFDNFLTKCKGNPYSTYLLDSLQEAIKLARADEREKIKNNIYTLCGHTVNRIECKFCYSKLALLKALEAQGE